MLHPLDDELLLEDDELELLELLDELLLDDELDEELLVHGVPVSVIVLGQLTVVSALVTPLVVDVCDCRARVVDSQLKLGSNVPDALLELDELSA